VTTHRQARRKFSDLILTPVGIEAALESIAMSLEHHAAAVLKEASRDDMSSVQFVEACRNAMVSIEMAYGYLVGPRRAFDLKREAVRRAKGGDQ
jgi:hypothetical protein